MAKHFTFSHFSRVAFTEDAYGCNETKSVISLLKLKHLNLTLITAVIRVNIVNLYFMPSTPSIV